MSSKSLSFPKKNIYAHNVTLLFNFSSSNFFPMFLFSPLRWSWSQDHHLCFVWNTLFFLLLKYLIWSFHVKTPLVDYEFSRALLLVTCNYDWTESWAIIPGFNYYIHAHSTLCSVRCDTQGICISIEDLRFYKGNVVINLDSFFKWT